MFSVAAYFGPEAGQPEGRNPAVSKAMDGEANEAERIPRLLDEGYEKKETSFRVVRDQRDHCLSLLVWILSHFSILDTSDMDNSENFCNMKKTDKNQE